MKKVQKVLAARYRHVGMATGAALVASPLAFATSGGSAGFDAGSLDSVNGVVTGLIATGVTITLAMVTYKIGKRVTNRV